MAGIRLLIYDPRPGFAQPELSELLRSGVDFRAEAADTPERLEEFLRAGEYDAIVAGAAPPLPPGLSALEIPVILLADRLMPAAALDALKGCCDVVRVGDPELFSAAVLRAARHSALVRDRRRLEERLHTQKRLYSVLTHLNQAIARVPERDRLFQEVCRIAVDDGLFRMAWFGLVDPATGLVRPVSHHGFEEGYLAGIRISVSDEPEGRGPTGAALRQGRHFICRDIASDDRMAPWRAAALARGYRSSAAFPVRVQGRLKGALTIYGSEPGFFDEESIALLDEVAADVSFALENLERDEQRRKAEQDRIELIARERAALAQAKAEARYRELLEAAPDAIFELDRDRRIVLANRAAERMFGVRREWLLGGPVDAILPDWDHRSGVAAGRRADASRFTVEISLAPVNTEPGSIVTCILRDITDRERAERERLRLMTELELRNREVERANRLKSEFLASMSHELRTPLNAVIGFADLLAEQKAGDLNEKQQRFVGHIRKASRHLLELINDILDLSKIEAGRAELHREVFSVDSALAEVLPTVRPLAQAKSIELESNTAPDLTVWADRVRFKQILYNLLSNAIKFTPERGSIGVDAEPAGAAASIAVWDTGIGIPAAEQDAIFHEFYQVGTTTRGIKEGTGLGLAITKRLIEQHGGAIRVESEPDKGSRFVFTLPSQAAETAAAEGV